MSGVSEEQVLCIFCNEEGPRAREDVIPIWLADELGGSPPILTTHLADFGGDNSRAFTQTHGSAAVLKYPDVCRDCNGGWMSRLEDSTKKILLPMIRGESTVLNQAAERQIAVWVQGKAIALDAYYSLHYGGFRHLPAFVAHTFAQEIQPLPYMPVTLGWLETFEEGLVIPFVRWVSELPLADSTEVDQGNATANAIRVTFALRFLIVQATIAAAEPNALVVPPPIPDDPRRVDIWPLRAVEVAWPPELTRRDDLRTIVGHPWSGMLLS